MDFGKKHLIGIVGGLLIILPTLIFLRQEKIFYFLIVSGMIISLAPFILSLIFESGKQKEVEERFLEFVRDLVENVKSGTPISRGIVNLKSRDYGELTPYVQKLANQISIGIPMTEAFMTFARDTKSPVI